MTNQHLVVGHWSFLLDRPASLPSIIRTGKAKGGDEDRSTLMWQPVVLSVALAGLMVQADNEGAPAPRPMRATLGIRVEPPPRGAAQPGVRVREVFPGGP